MWANFVIRGNCNLIDLDRTVSPSAEILICHELGHGKYFLRNGFPRKWRGGKCSGLNHKTDFFSRVLLKHLDKKLFRNAKCLIDTSIFEDFIWMVYLQWAKTIHTLQRPTERGRFGELVRWRFLIFKGNRSSDSIRGNRNFKRNPCNSVI